MTEKATGNESRSTANLFSDAIAHTSALFRKELDLVKAEVRENVSHVGVAIGLIAGGLVFILVALNVLSAALVAGLTELGMEAGWAAMIVGVAYLVIAINLVRKGTRDLKAVNLAPTRTADSVRRDAQALKETFNGKR